jgi:HK97 family phage portal protein
MRLFGFNITRNTPSTTRRSLSPSVMEWLRGDDLGTLNPHLQNAYQQQAWVYRAVNVLAEQVANIPFRFSVGEAGGEHLITRGPLQDFYARPHPHINRFQYWELRIIWLMLRGECFRIPIFEDAVGTTSTSSETSGAVNSGTTWKSSLPSIHQSSNPSIHSSRRRLRGVLILDPAHFQHIIQDNQLIGWRYTGFGETAPLASQVFLPEEVWHERLPNPFDFWRGLPPLYAAASAAKTDFAAGIFMQGLIQNNGDTGLIVSSKRPLSDEQKEQLDAEIRSRRCRAGAMNTPLVLSGVTEMLKPQLSSSDLQFLENRKFSRAEICAAFGVPEEIITTTDGAKYDIMAGARLNFIENRVAPLCRRLEAEEEVTVKALDPNAAGWFDLDSLPIMQEARQNRLAAAQTGFSMGVPFNELNRVLDLGFKPLPWGEKGFVASNLVQLGEQSFAKGEVRVQKSEVREQTDPFEKALNFLCRRREGEIPSTNIEPPDKLQTPNSKSAERAILAGKLRRFFFEQRSRILSKLASVERSISPIGPISSIPLFDLAAENTKLLSRLPQLAPAAATEINRAILAELQQALDESRGETADQLRDRIRQIYNHAANVRAKEIAERLQQGEPIRINHEWTRMDTNANA